MLSRRLRMAAAGYDVDALAYFAAMTSQPDATRKSQINTLILGLKADSLWAKIDWLLLMAAHDFAAGTPQAARVNVRNPSKVAAVVGTLTNSALGITGDGTTGALNFGEAFQQAPNVYSQNSAFLMSYVNGGADAGTYEIGTPVDNSIRLGARGVGLVENSRLNSGNTAVTSTGVNGCRIISRTGATAGDLYRDGVAMLAGVLPVSGSPPTNFGRVFQSNTDFSARRVAAVASGGGLTSGEAANLRLHILNYLTAIGAN